MIVDKVVCCENNHRFRLGNNTDGYNHCPECDHLLKEVPADVTKGEPFTLRYLYQAFIKKKEHKSSARNLTVDVTINTDKVQLKLRAIAKHADALADELDVIDNTWSCDCGSTDYEDTDGFVNSNKEFTIRKCTKCNEQYSFPTLMKKTNNKQVDAIYSSIQRLELYLHDAGITLPSNREDVDWQLFENELLTRLEGSD